MESACFRSAYLLYYFDVHQIMQQEIPNLPQSEINKRISESWKRLSVAEKSYYLEKAKTEKEGIATVSYILNSLFVCFYVHIWAFMETIYSQYNFLNKLHK